MPAVAVVHHVSFRVVPGTMTVAEMFMTDVLGWRKDEARADRWETGEYVFYNDPSSAGIPIQLCVEESGFAGDPTDAFHLALAVPDVLEMLKQVQTWCRTWGFENRLENVTSGKWMFMLPGVFYFAVEFVPA